MKNDIDFIFDLLENILNKKEKNILDYMEKHMTKDEINNHLQNIWYEFPRSQGVIAEIKMRLLADGRGEKI